MKKYVRSTFGTFRVVWGGSACEWEIKFELDGQNDVIINWVGCGTPFMMIGDISSTRWCQTLIQVVEQFFGCQAEEPGM